jgi:hypothetical protein
MKSLREQIASRCVHFNGIQHEKCAAGVELISIRDTTHKPYRWPCIVLNNRDAATICEKRHMPSPAEVDAEEAMWNAKLAEMDKGEVSK